MYTQVAFWNKRIPDEERHMLLGGWKESFDQVMMMMMMLMKMIIMMMIIRRRPTSAWSRRSTR